MANEEDVRVNLDGANVTGTDLTDIKLHSANLIHVGPGRHIRPATRHL